MYRKFCIIIIMNLAKVKAHSAKLEGHVVGGILADINNYAHSAFLTVSCKTAGGILHFLCGSSILNQEILVTAAHCIEDCQKITEITANAGNANKNMGSMRTVKNVLVHKKYNTKTLENDIALARLKNRLKFGKNIRRIILMKKPPYHEPAEVAGWGMVDEEKRVSSLYLKSAEQAVWSRASCLLVLVSMPKGTFCAGLRKEDDYAAEGDSGSAIAVRRFIQIGLVSYKNPYISPSLTVYTDVGYQYNWIQESAQELYCEENSLIYWF